MQVNRGPRFFAMVLHQFGDVDFWLTSTMSSVTSTFYREPIGDRAFIVYGSPRIAEEVLDILLYDIFKTPLVVTQNDIRRWRHAWCSMWRLIGSQYSADWFGTLLRIRD